MATLSPEAFEDDVHLHTKFGFHVQMIYYVHSVVAVFMDLIPIILGLILFMYPEIHRSSAVYPQFFQYYDRTHAYQYYIVYNSTVFIWILLHFLHVLAIGISIFGVRWRKPYFMLPQLIFLLFRVGVLLLLFCALITFNFVGSELAIYSTLIVFVLVSFSCSYLVSTVLCFRFVFEKFETIALILASSKTVHFKGCSQNSRITRLPCKVHLLD